MGDVGVQAVRVYPETDVLFFWEGEAPAEPRSDDSATVVEIRSPAGADSRDPVAMVGPHPPDCGSAGASPSLGVPKSRSRVSGQPLSCTIFPRESEQILPLPGSQISMIFTK